MIKIAYLVPREEMVEQVERISRDMDLPVFKVERITSEMAEKEALRLIAEGADMIVARGYQAFRIKRVTNVPVVEIVMTGQEMGLLVTKAKVLLQRDCPRIAVVGYANMFCDMRFFDEIYGVKLHLYEVEDVDEDDSPVLLEEAAKRAIADHADLIIGGDIALACAKQAGIASVFLSSTDDSIRQSFHIAQRVAYASSLEKRNTSEMKALLDYSFSVFVKLNQDGTIAIVNHVAETLFNWKEQEVVGRPILQVTDAIGANLLHEVLVNGNEVFSTVIRINQISLVANLVPIIVQDKIDGALLSCHEVNRLEEMGMTARRELYQLNYVAKCTFSVLQEASSQMQQVIAQANIYAQSDAPVLISGETGTEKFILAQCIHNAGSRKNHPFVSVESSGLSPQEQLEQIFGTQESGQQTVSQPKGLLGKAHTGTVFINDVSKLSECAQYRLLQLLRDKILMSNGDSRPLPIDVRVIAATDCNLIPLVQSGDFLEELFFALNTLDLDVPPLRERPDDILYWADKYIQEFSTLYKRYIVITAGGRKMLCSYAWNGNLVQLKSFCECMVLTASKRSVDENFIENLLFRMYPLIRAKKAKEKIVIYKDPEAAVIAELLGKYDGNRSKVAQEMKISTTTLWRKIKKYNIAVHYQE